MGEVIAFDLGLRQKPNPTAQSLVAEVMYVDDPVETYKSCSDVEASPADAQMAAVLQQLFATIPIEKH